MRGSERRRPNFCFAGHTDVVPPGDAKLWRHDPFAAEIADGMLYGRGAADMKSAIAAFVAAAARYLADGKPKGSISLLITGDEEGPAINGTPKMLDWLKEHGETLDHCIVGEPTATARAGDTIKIGRRGSMNTRRDGARRAGPCRPIRSSALNPIPALAALVTRLSSHVLDKGTEHFEPSTLAFTTVDVGNPATNVIPAEARAAFNIRFNDPHTPDIAAALDRRPKRTPSRQTRAARSRSTVSVSGDVVPHQAGRLHRSAARSRRKMRPATRRNSPPPAARRMRASSRIIARWRNLAFPAARCTRPTNACRWRRSQRLSDIYEAILEHYFANPPQ